MQIWVSLLIGLAAWAFALLASAKRSAGWMFSSFTACCIAAILPFFEIQWRFEVNDAGGAMDTIGGIIFGEVVLITVTILLNAIALYRMKKQ